MSRVIVFDGVRHEFPDDFTDGDVTRALASYKAPTGAPSDQSRVGAVQTPNFNRDWQRVGLNALPAVGGALGGLAGGAMAGPPGAFAGAELGGGIGAASREALARAGGFPASADPLADIARQTLVQGGAELGGQMLTSGLRAAFAKPMMGAALRTNDRAAIDAALSERVAPGRSIFGKGTGTDQIEDVTGSLVRDRRGVLNRADAAGAAMDPQHVLDPLEQYVASIEKRAERSTALQPQAKALREEFERFKAANGKGPIPASEVQQLKQDYADLASQGYKTDAAGNPIKLTNTELRFNKLIADKTRGWLADNLGLGPTNERIQGLMRLRPRMAKAEATAPPPVISRGPLGFLDVANPMAYARAMPGLSGRAAVATVNPFLKDYLLRQLPRGAAALAFPPQFPDTIRTGQ